MSNILVRITYKHGALEQVRNTIVGPRARVAWSISDCFGGQKNAVYAALTPEYQRLPFFFNSPTKNIRPALRVNVAYNALAFLGGRVKKRGEEGRHRWPRPEENR